MQLLKGLLDNFFPDGVIYLLIAVTFAAGVVKCSVPLFRNTGALSRGANLLREGAKAKLARPLWDDPGFLGKRLQPAWRAFLQSADLSRTNGIACDVAEFIHDDSVITEPGKAAVADIIPGICTSLGILGTFVGLVIGLTGLDIMNEVSYIQLTKGISVAFYTSIVGLVGSLLFNVINRTAVGRARRSLDRFVAAFYKYAIPRPSDVTTQLLVYEREQADSLGQFAQDISVRMAGEINHAIAKAMMPIQRTMEDFMKMATRAQVDGLDFIVARFIDRMNKSLDGQLSRLGEALAQTADGQLKAQADLQNTVSSIGDLTQSVVEVQAISEQVIQKFAVYITDMEKTYRQVSDTQADTAELLESMGQSSARQARYLSALQEYQAKLQSSFQDYTLWTDRYVGGLEKRTAQQSESLEQIAMEMRASSELLRGAYKSFVESIELGLANALGLFDENMQNLTRQIHGTLSDIQETMTQLESAMARAVRTASTEREVS
ncbi:MAG: MotA/TolQ/ExbB proton channel family protein [Firmicutes bacterium]|nr:MotA/TolQ/ExbB proton channel family protein [Bacillota bacterium]